MNQPRLNPDAFDLACKELFLTITAHKSAADVLGFDWKSLKASTRKPWETATRKVLTAYLEADGTAEELHEINTRLARILTDTANALKGEPEPHVMHSWHDLADVAKRAVDGLKEQTDVQSVDNYLAAAQPVAQKITDVEWQAFQAIPDQGYSHRSWVDARIAERVAVAQPVVNSFDPRGLNRKGWSCGCEPGNYDSCDECRSACNELANFLNRPEVDDA